MPRGSFSHAANVSATAAEVWQRFQDPVSWQQIAPIDDIRDVVRDGDRLASFAWSAHIGPSRYRGRSDLVENIPERRVVMRLDSTEMGGRLAVDLDSRGDATDITVTLDVVTKGTMSSLFYPIIAETITRGLPGQVDDFAASFG